jgi:hypothetical protein
MLSAVAVELVQHTFIPSVYDKWLVTGDMIQIKSKLTVQQAVYVRVCMCVFHYIVFHVYCNGSLGSSSGKCYNGYCVMEQLFSHCQLVFVHYCFVLTPLRIVSCTEVTFDSQHAPRMTALYLWFGS